MNTSWVAKGPKSEGRRKTVVMLRRYTTQRPRVRVQPLYAQGATLTVSNGQWASRAAVLGRAAGHH